MSFKSRITILVTLFCCIFSLPSTSQSAVLQTSWEQWVVERHQDLNCPWLISTNKDKICNWPGEFVGTIVEDGMLFEMSVQVFSKDALIDLPGNKQNWPTALTVNKNSAAVVDSNGIPKVHLHTGANIIRGKFLWQEIPAAIAFPKEIALVNVFSNNKSLPISINDDQLILSLHNQSTQIEQKNSLKIQVYRALRDEVPLRLTTIIKLFVSGKAREVTIGQVAIAESQTVYLQSALPARLEEDGMLRVQVKPGIYEITVGSRLSDNRTIISSNKISPQWPQYEYLSFIADSRIREVEISGVKSIDTSLVDIPTPWKSYPTYRLGLSDQLLLKTTTQGDTAAHQNRINIDREIWISFDGSDAIVKDNVSGTMHQGWRLDAAKTVKLGRASVDATPVLITHYAGNDGVEIRNPKINLQAVSSLPSVNRINALGWQSEAEKLTARIHLPPGWRAVYASGVDGISGTWLQKWNLWDLFWLMILIAAANKLLGFKGALLIAVTLIFTFHEDQAPNAIWAVLLTFIAVIKLPIGKYKVLLSRVAILPAVILLITFISIAISSLRLAVYPTLEKQRVTNYSSSYNQQNNLDDMQEMEISLAADTAIMSKRLSRSKIQSDSYEEAPIEEKQNLYLLGDNDRVQTGPGIPRWSWNSLFINSQGTVTADQQINLLLSPPILTALWRILNVLLIGAMGVILLLTLFKVAKFKATDDPNDNTNNSRNSVIESKYKKAADLRSTVSVLLIALLFPLLSVSMLLLSEVAEAAIQLPATDGYPPEYLLKEYENRVLASPQCLPSCVSLNNGLLQVKDKQMNLIFDLFADADIAMPLPMAGDTWQAQKITIDNKPAVLRNSEQGLTIFLSKGKHVIIMQGQVSNAEITINLPLNIHNFKVDAPSWQIEGIRKGVIVNNNISLTSKEVLAQQEITSLTPLPVKPYAIVNRSITLGKEWRMLTKVTKLAPNDEAGTFNIALLSGEQILSAYPINENNSVSVQFRKNQGSISWQSALPQNELLTLTAANSPSYSETWRLIPSSLWNVKFTGIKPLKSEIGSGQLQPLWKPWPGETLAVHVSRPEGVAGEVFTTEMATLIQQTGKNVQNSKLTLTVRASQGTAYEIMLAQGVKINALVHDGKRMSINSANRAIVQLHPGEQQIELEFEKRAEFTWRNRSADIKLPGKSVNINIEYHLLSDRWLIYLNGPPLGAAILFWGVLFVILIGAIVLPIIARKSQLNIPITSLGWVLLGLGFSTVNSYGLLIIALFFFAMAARNQYVNPANMLRWKFNTLQLALLVLTFVCGASLLAAIPSGLLSTPQMQVAGNGSYGHLFKFFQDKVSTGQLPIVTVYSLPIWFYRIVMLAWSLWIATRLIGWGKWWFSSYSRDGAWIAKVKKTDLKQKTPVEQKQG
jgi:hypothetical protein